MMRCMGFLALVGACAPAVPAGAPGPLPEAGSALRDLGPTGGMGARRLLIELAHPAHVLLLEARGSGLYPMAISPEPRTPLPGGRHVVTERTGGISGRGGDCASPSLRMEAVFPTGQGFLPSAGLGEPALPPAAGAVPVLTVDPDFRGCATPSASVRGQLFLFTGPGPFDAAAVYAALGAVPPGTSPGEAARQVASALGAELFFGR